MRGGVERIWILLRRPFATEANIPATCCISTLKKLGRIVRPGHRVTGNKRDHVSGAGWEFVHVAIDDASRFASLGIEVRQLMSDNGSAYRSYPIATFLHQQVIEHIFTRPYTPRTNGKAERFIQTSLREWAYAAVYQNSRHRHQHLRPWLHRYNWHRPHTPLNSKLRSNPAAYQ
jgi:transposase InsO family protein